ncbi:phage/plasmid primase, P4 family [Crossiella sp. CA198]|uniref:phage/plasmid primase, P4 family n=1 Tax=Crossiella sp. CA198 TaxID=3455607 RepID=UPI003F8D6969
MLLRCPAHSDGRPSLYVSLTPEGRALVYCRAGCPTDLVLQRAAVSTAELFDVRGDPTLTGGPVTELDAAAVAALGVYVAAAAERYPGSPAADYAARRFGLSADAAAQLRLGYDDATVTVGQARDYRPAGYLAHPRLVVPFADADGVPRGLQGRDIGGACPARWMNLASPGGQQWDACAVFRLPGAFTTTVVTEGPGDGLTAAGAGYTAVAVRGAGVARAERAAREIARVAGQGGDVVLCGDNDDAGRAFVAALAAGLIALGITPRVLVVPDDADDLTAWRAQTGESFASELHRAVGSAAPWSAEPIWVTAPTKPAGTMQGTDIENARLALSIVGPDTSYVDGIGFLSWTGRVWQPMSSTRERAIGHRVADAMRRALEEMPRGDADGSREQQRQAEEHGHAVRRTRRMHMDTGIRACLDHLRTITAADPGDFDRAEHLLSFTNGTVDLRTGVLREHRREDRLTRMVHLDYNPDAECPRWTQFLAEVFEHDPDLPDYLRRLIGYGITGSTREHVFAVLYGSGANGKSVFVNTLARVFSGITGHLSQAAIGYTRSFDPSAPNPALAALRGVRLAMLSELSDGLRLNEALLKQITAGDPVVARELYKGQFVFTPTALLLLATNYKPDVRGQDDGFWRRTRLVPFRRGFVGAQRDPGLLGRLLDETTGIAAWAVRGAVAWYRDGLGEPESVRAAVAEYRRASDQLDGYLPGVLVRDPGGEIPLDEAYSSYVDWVDVEQGGGQRPWGKITFRRAMESRKVGTTRRARGVILRGVRRARAEEMV